MDKNPLQKTTKSSWKLPFYATAGGLGVSASCGAVFAWQAASYGLVALIGFTSIVLAAIGIPLFFYLQGANAPKTEPAPNPETPYPRTGLCRRCGRDIQASGCPNCIRKATVSLAIALIAWPPLIILGGIIGRAGPPAGVYGNERPMEQPFMLVGLALGAIFAIRAYIRFKRAQAL